jgi:REP element-mobilizing transposase RayT
MQRFDYSQPAYHFVTINIKDRRPILGRIEDGKMINSELGDIVAETWAEIPRQYTGVRLHASQVMPDHFHAVIEFIDGNPSDVTLIRVIQQFKGAVTKRANMLNIPAGNGMWQRSYWSKVFWMDHDLAKIEKYIFDNPLKHAA